MKKNIRIFLGITAVVVAGIIIYRKRNRKNNNNDHMLAKISDEGYETAHDVLFPNKFKKERDLRYGPILPK